MLTIKLRYLLVVVIGAWVLSGCVSAPKDIYYWGEYEQLIYDMYVNPGEADAAVQIEKLNTGIQKAESIGKPVPPGVYAHLGFMYATQGQMSQGEAALLEEQKRYPESTVFIQGLIERASKIGGK